jgi:DNA-binding NarL/FixJ family response regulator
VVAVRILIAEDSALLRQGLVRLLSDAGHTIVEAADEPALRAIIDRPDAPEFALLDIRLPPGHTDEGARAALQLRARHPEVGILLLSQHVEARYAQRLLADHPERIGYLLKDRVTDVDELLAAIDRIAAGGTAIDATVVAQLLRHASTHHTLDALTPREHDVLALMAEGLSNRAIAARARLSDKTVENHVSSILMKLGLSPDDRSHRRVQAVLAYIGR